MKSPGVEDKAIRYLIHQFPKVHAYPLIRNFYCLGHASKEGFVNEGPNRLRKEGLPPPDRSLLSLPGRED